MIRRATPQQSQTEAGRAGLSSLYCAEPLELVLRRERARSERTGRVFSLLVFHLGPANAACEWQLAAILAQRLRIMDYMGPLGTARLGVVLPETPPAGAQVLAEHVREECSAAGISPPCEIYSYPTRYSLDGDEGRNGECSACHGDGAGHGHSYPVRPMELLFCRQLPRWKRCLDIAAAAFGLVATAPVVLVAAAAIKCTSPGPVFFTQLRAGLGGKPFKLYKLRTMGINAEAAKAEMRQHSEQDGPAFKMKRDPRVTRIGRLLRSTSLDELPQFLNVLRGNMSLVGPRPLPCDESANCHPWQRRRLDVTPGLTCIWQVTGRSSVSFDEWMRMDLSYVRSRTLLHDLKLILMTIPAVLLRRGAH